MVVTMLLRQHLGPAIMASVRRATAICTWPRNTARSSRDSERRNTSWSGTSIDIHVHQKTVAELRDRERELSQLVDMVPSHLWRLSPDGEPIFFNKRMVGLIWAWTVAETNKPGITRLAALIETTVHPDDAAAFRERAQPLPRHRRALFHEVSPAARRRRVSLDVEPCGADAGSRVDASFSGTASVTT